MIQNRNFPSALKRITPAPKLWLSLGLILSIVLVKNSYFAYFTIFISVIMVIKEKQMFLFKMILVTILILFVSMFGIHGAMAPIIDTSIHTPLFEIMGINYYSVGFEYASQFFLTVAPLMCSLFLLFVTIDPTDLGVVMCKAGISYNKVFTFIDSFQVITLLSKDMEQIRDAQRARGLNTEGNVFQRTKAFIPIMVPVVANSIIKIQDQAIAMDTKGFNSKCKKTIYRDLVPTKIDPVFKWVGIIMSVASITYFILKSVNVIEPFLTNIM